MGQVAGTKLLDFLTQMASLNEGTSLLVCAGVYCKGSVRFVCFSVCRLDGGKMAHGLKNSWHDTLKRVATICRP